MKRTVLIVLLSLGAVSGIAIGVRHSHCRAERHEQFKQMVATTCVEAAQKVLERQGHAPDAP